MNLLALIKRGLLNIPGWHTDRKIVVFESDDWGCIRMPSKTAFDRLQSKGVPVNKSKYLTYDNFETNDDLTALFEVLESVKDINANPARLTANTIVANPDFASIKDSGFKDYFYKSFVESIPAFPQSDKVLSIIEQGQKSRVYQPQFHGREHVNIVRWLADLRSGNKVTHEAFENEVCGINMAAWFDGGKNYLPAFDYDDLYSKDVSLQALSEGLPLFERIFGFRSKTFIAPAYTWHTVHEALSAKFGVESLQGNPLQKLPSFERTFFRKTKFHFLGERNRYGQIYLTRNAYFEPTLKGRSNINNSCLQQIGNAFSWRKPAIVGCHRLNFMGGIVESNRTQNLELFSYLLKEIMVRWPDVEFMSSDQLSELIKARSSRGK